MVNDDDMGAYLRRLMLLDRAARGAKTRARNAAKKAAKPKQPTFKTEPKRRALDSQSVGLVRELDTGQEFTIDAFERRWFISHVGKAWHGTHMAGGAVFEIRRGSRDEFIRLVKTLPEDIRDYYKRGPNY